MTDEVPLKPPLGIVDDTTVIANQHREAAIAQEVLGRRTRWVSEQGGRVRPEVWLQMRTDLLTLTRMSCQLFKLQFRDFSDSRG